MPQPSRVGLDHRRHLAGVGGELPEVPSARGSIRAGEPRAATAGGSAAAAHRGDRCRATAGARPAVPSPHAREALRGVPSRQEAPGGDAAFHRLGRRSLRGVESRRLPSRVPVAPPSGRADRLPLLPLGAAAERRLHVRRGSAGRAGAPGDTGSSRRGRAVSVSAGEPGARRHLAIEGLTRSVSPQRHPGSAGRHLAME